MSPDRGFGDARSLSLYILPPMKVSKLCDLEPFCLTGNTFAPIVNFWKLSHVIFTLFLLVRITRGDFQPPPRQLPPLGAPLGLGDIVGGCTVVRGEWGWWAEAVGNPGNKSSISCMLIVSLERGYVWTHATCIVKQRNCWQLYLDSFVVSRPFAL